MAGSCWRLLAILSLILVAPVFPRAQDSVEERIPFPPRNVGILGHPSFLDSKRLPLGPNFPQQLPVSPRTLAFQKIARAAGIIFSGHVTSIGHMPVPEGQAPASTTLTFQVDQAIRGTSAGQILTIHEWAGLWARGEQYRIGEHVFLFLYPPSKLGLTSPVAGVMGRFAMDAQGHILMNGQHVAAWEGDPILAGRRVIPYSDFKRALRRFGREE
jgi:hypothetical protein